MSWAWLWLLTIVTRPPGAIVTLAGLTLPSLPIVIVAVVGLGPVGVVGVVGVVGAVGVVGVLLPPPHATAVAATNAAAARPVQIALVIRKISSKD
jgi:hypothetical protein